MKKAVLYLMCALFFSSCYDVTGPEEEALLTGSWLLTRVSGGFAGEKTDISAEEGRKVVFTEGGIVSYYSKDKLARSTTFSLKKGKSIYSQDEKSIIHFADSFLTPMVILELTEKTMVLADNMYDGYSFTYRKEK